MSFEISPRREAVSTANSMIGPMMGRSDGKIRPSVICALQSSDGHDRMKSGALAEYMAAVEALWARLVQNNLGHWLRDNGIREFRLMGEFLIDPRQAMAAIG